MKNQKILVHWLLVISEKSQLGLTLGSFWPKNYKNRVFPKKIICGQLEKSHVLTSDNIWKTSFSAYFKSLLGQKVQNISPTKVGKVNFKLMQLYAKIRKILRINSSRNMKKKKLFKSIQLSLCPTARLIHWFFTNLKHFALGPFWPKNFRNIFPQKSIWVNFKTLCYCNFMQKKNNLKAGFHSSHFVNRKLYNWTGRLD